MLGYGSTLLLDLFRVFLFWIAANNFFTITALTPSAQVWTDGNGLYCDVFFIFKDRKELKQKESDGRKLNVLFLSVGKNKEQHVSLLMCFGGREYLCFYKALYFTWRTNNQILSQLIQLRTWTDHSLKAWIRKHPHGRVSCDWRDTHCAIIRRN